MKQNSKRLTSILLSLGFVVIALVLLFDLVEPEYENLMTLKGQVAGESAFLATEKNAIAQAQKLIAQSQNQSASSADTMLALPSGPDAAGAIAQLYGLADNSGIAIQTIQISPPALEQVATANTSAGNQVIKPLGTIVFQVSAAGSYESLKSFLVGLETNIRLFNVQGISIVQAQQPVATTKNAVVAPQDLYTYTLKIATYYQAP